MALRYGLKNKGPASLSARGIRKSWDRGREYMTSDPKIVEHIKGNSYFWWEDTKSGEKSEAQGDALEMLSHRKAELSSVEARIGDAKKELVATRRELASIERDLAKRKVDLQKVNRELTAARQGVLPSTPAVEPKPAAKAEEPEEAKAKTSKASRRRVKKE